MLRGILATVLLAGMIGILTVSFWIPAFIYRPAPLSRPNPSDWGLPGALSVTISSGSADRLFGWWLPPPSPMAPVVLIIHGRSANISTRASVAARLSADGFGVLLFDFRGYGRSTGRSTESSLTEDAKAAYDWLRGQGIGDDRIMVIGQSLGDAPAAELSASRPVRALALVSPFTSLPGAMADRLGWPPLQFIPWPRNRFDVRPSIRALRAPVIFVVSRDDGLVPYVNSRRIAADALHPHWLEVGGQRHDGLLEEVTRTGRLSQALKALFAEGPAR
jgi:pimeloyl-ACP methyl ester carboxylesterase